jgi:exonuclease III
VYSNENARRSVNDLIVMAREIGIVDFDNCLENTSYDLVFQQETKLAKNEFSLKALPANIFINKTTGDWVLVPGYYPTNEVLPGIEKII